jgi:hypothetical protein
MEQAYSELREARGAHMELERVYLPYLDIPALRALNGSISL